MWWCWWFSCSVMSYSCDPMDCGLPGFSVPGLSQARILEWLPFPSPGDLPDPGMEPTDLLLLRCRLMFTAEPPGKPWWICVHFIIPLTFYFKILYILYIYFFNKHFIYILYKMLKEKHILKRRCFLKPEDAG